MLAETSTPTDTNNEDLVRGHLGLADVLARRWGRGAGDTEELTQVARIGLWKASRRYDPSRGVPFSSWAALTISGEVKRHRRDRGWRLHLPRAVHDTMVAVTGWVEQLTGELGRPPTVEEISRRSGLSEEQVSSGLQAAGNAPLQSLDAAEEAVGEGTLSELATEDAGFERSFARQEVARLIDLLDGEERTVVTLRFFHDLTQREIGRRIGRSQMHVSRVLVRALQRMRAGGAEDLSA